MYGSTCVWTQVETVYGRELITMYGRELYLCMDASCNCVWTQVVTVYER